MAKALKTSNYASNLLNRQFEAYGPRMVLLTDISYIPYNDTLVVFGNYQNNGYGTKLMAKIEETAKNNDAEHVELICVNDEHHANFYTKSGYLASERLWMMGKHFKK